MADNSDHPVVIVGAGPVGLAAASQLLSRGLRPLVLEAGSGPGSSIRRWGQVRLFSPWKYLVETASRRLLEAAGWAPPPDERLPTGAELVDEYLEPLAALPDLRPHLRFNHRVTGVTRRGHDKLSTTGRARSPFEVHARLADGREVSFSAPAVIDASGTYSQPNPLGAGGQTVPGEHEHRERITYGIPEALGRDRARFAGKRVLVLGRGHSAFQALLDLCRLKLEVPDTEVSWVTRRGHTPQLFGGGANDALPARGRMGTQLQKLVALGAIDWVRGFRAASVLGLNGGLLVEDGERRLGPFDELIVTTGFRPDLELFRELRVTLDPVLESPVALAPLIDPNVHSCGTVYPHGYEELRHPEEDFYIAGMKSYGRAPTFLLLTGYEQVRSIVSAIAGDLEGARRVELKLPPTGVCSSDGTDSTCCAPS